MKLFLLSFILAFLAFQQPANGYRILGIFPLYGKSHWVMMESLMKGLAARGHQVDVYTPFKSKPVPNYREIRVLDNLGTAVNNMTATQIQQFTNINVQFLVKVAGDRLCEMLSVPEFQELIKNPPTDPPYDIFITELFASPCYLAFGRHLKVPSVGVMTCPFHDWLSHHVANPDEPAYVPNVFSGYSQQMTFWERLSNTVVIHLLQLQMDYYVSPHAKYVKEHFGIDTTVTDLYKDLSLVLVNSHHSLNGIRPFTKAVVEVGGLHLQNNDLDELAPDVKKWLDESTHGCVYFTFGSMVRIETFSKELLEAFYKSFENIAPVRVLMKVAKKEELLPGLPKNVMIKPWFSQIPILKHKNVRAFITHGGLMGTTEAIFCGVPMIGIPLFGDQKVNILNYVNRKVAISMGSISEVTEEKLTKALKTILNDPSYMENTKKLSQTFSDRPMSAIDTATYWIEYVIRHGNALQSPAIHLPWWQRNLLDVYATIILGIVIVLSIVLLILRAVVCYVKRFFRKSEPKKPSKSKKYN